MTVSVFQRPSTLVLFVVWALATPGCTNGCAGSAKEPIASEQVLPTLRATDAASDSSSAVEGGAGNVTEERLRVLLHDWDTRHTIASANLLGSMYADQVMFFGVRQPRSAVVAAKVAALARDASFSQNSEILELTTSENRAAGIAAGGTGYRIEYRKQFVRRGKHEEVVGYIHLTASPALLIDQEGDDSDWHLGKWCVQESPGQTPEASSESPLPEYRQLLVGMKLSAANAAHAIATDPEFSRSGMISPMGPYFLNAPSSCPTPQCASAVKKCGYEFMLDREVDVDGHRVHQMEGTFTVNPYSGMTFWEDIHGNVRSKTLGVAP